MGGRAHGLSCLPFFLSNFQILQKNRLTPSMVNHPLNFSFDLGRCVAVVRSRSRGVVCVCVFFKFAGGAMVDAPWSPFLFFLSFWFPHSAKKKTLRLPPFMVKHPGLDMCCFLGRHISCWQKPLELGPPIAAQAPNSGLVLLIIIRHCLFLSFWFFSAISIYGKTSSPGIFVVFKKFWGRHKALHQLLQKHPLTGPRYNIYIYMASKLSEIMTRSY